MGLGSEISNKSMTNIYQMHDVLPLPYRDGVSGGDAVHLVGGDDHGHVGHVARFQHLSGGIQSARYFISR